MALTPSTLFHFTKRKKFLTGILTDNFKLKYCLETISHEDLPLEISIPMVSFCDIKLSEIKDHIDKYGCYGIGLSKSWAVEKGLNPVLYLNGISPFATGIIRTIRKISSSSNLPVEDKIISSNFLRYIKLYEGELIRSNIKIPNYRFADEREWRYVPPNTDAFLAWLPKHQYNSKNKKKEANEKLKNERLVFSANDILYIIVKTEGEIREIINHIRVVKGKVYDSIDIDRLTTRIISCERIFNDF